MPTPATSLTTTDLSSAIVCNPLIVVADTKVMDAIACMDEAQTIIDWKTLSVRDRMHQEERSSCVLVMEGEQIIGIMTERDIVRLRKLSNTIQELLRSLK